MRLEESVVRFTIIPDQGTQVWAELPVVCFPRSMIILSQESRTNNHPGIHLRGHRLHPRIQHRGNKSRSPTLGAPPRPPLRSLRKMGAAAFNEKGQSPSPGIDD